MLPAFLFPVQIPDFYVDSRSLYAQVSLLLSKWPDFYPKVLVWVRTSERRPVRPLWGEGGGAREVSCTKLVGGVDLNGWIFPSSSMIVDRSKVAGKFSRDLR